MNSNRCLSVKYSVAAERPDLQEAQDHQYKHLQLANNKEIVDQRIVLPKRQNKPIIVEELLTIQGQQPAKLNLQLKSYLLT